MMEDPSQSVALENGRTKRMSHQINRDYFLHKEFATSCLLKLNKNTMKAESTLWQVERKNEQKLEEQKEQLIPINKWR